MARLDESRVGKLVVTWPARSH